MKATLIAGRLLLAAALAVPALSLLPATATAAPCTSNCLTPGDRSETISAGGRTRQYLIHVPANYQNGTAVPLVLDLHGYTSNPAEQRRISGQLQQSDKRGFIVVWPQGTGATGYLSWNGYKCCGSAQSSGVDDVGFLRTLVASIKARANIDDNRTYITGLSNGGSMSHRMACEASDLIRASAPVSFVLNRDETQCKPTRIIPLTEFHGTSDNLVYYNGGGGGGQFQSAPASRDIWAKIDGCSGSYVTTALPYGSKSEIYTTCKNGVRTGLVTVYGGYHELYSNNSVDIADYIWKNVFK